MSFWSGERLAVELPKGLVVPFDPKRIDCASYPLCVGDQAFVTSDKFADSHPGDPIVTVLSSPPHHTIRIPPGQFAFLLTDEVVAVPDTAIALISIKTKYKFQGLINVSGFHVDPGFHGKLLFSLYNAGPSEVILEKGQTMFMIVYADLDQATTKLYNRAANGRTGIDPSLVQGMTSQVFSPLMLQRRIEALASKVDGVDRTAETWKTVTIAVTSVATVLLAAAALLATLAPSMLGVVLARTIESAGYEFTAKSGSPGIAGSTTRALEQVREKDLSPKPAAPVTEVGKAADMPIKRSAPAASQ